MKYIKSILSVMLVTVFIITSGINSSALELSGKKLLRSNYEIRD